MWSLNRLPAGFLIRVWLAILLFLGACAACAAADGPACNRPLTLALHEHGLLYSASTDSGIDKDFADELVKRSGCRITVSVMARARIWEMIESGALDFSLSGISSEARHKFAGFAWYFSNKYYLLVRNDAKVRELAGFEADTRLQLGVVRSFRYGEKTNQFVDWLTAENRVAYASGLEPLYQILALDRIQGMIIEPFDYSQVAGRAIRDVTTIIDTGDGAVPHGLIMSRKSLPAVEQAKWQALVQAMRADGTVLRIFEKYFSPELARAMTVF